MNSGLPNQRLFAWLAGSSYLQGLHAGFSDRVRVKVLPTSTDLGIKDVCKETLNQARGEFLCLLNNDTVVTPGWMVALTSLAKKSEGYGMTGPMSN